MDWPPTKNEICILVQSPSVHREVIAEFAKYLIDNPSGVEVAEDLLSVVQCYAKNESGKVDLSHIRINCKVCGACPHCAPKEDKCRETKASDA